MYSTMDISKDVLGTTELPALLMDNGAQKCSGKFPFFPRRLSRLRLRTIFTTYLVIVAFILLLSFQCGYSIYYGNQELYTDIQSENCSDFNVLEDFKFNTEENETGRIYFIETSGRTQFNRRQLCSIESAARLNSNRDVHILTVNRRFCIGNGAKEILEIPNVFVSYLNISSALEGLPVESFVQKLEDKKKYWNKLADTSDLMRGAVLYKTGGTYLDLDVISLKTLSGYSNCVALETEDVATSAVLVNFDRQNPLILKFMQLQRKNFREGVWGSMGPKALTAAIVSYEAENYLEICKFSKEKFHPISWREAPSIFWPDGNMNDYYWMTILAGDPIGVHVFNKVTAQLPLERKENIYTRLGLHACPISMKTIV